jgi:uncharacterized membrane protein HdeD (DUF308 family)
VSPLLPVSPIASMHDELTSLRNHWWLYFTLGLVTVIVGFVAISSVVVATLATVFVYGVLLLIAGITEVIHAVMVRNMKGFALHLLAAAVYLLVGLFLIEDPVRAAVVLTLVLAASFLVGGLLRSLIAVVHQFPGWPMVLLHGMIDLVLGIMILSGWPESSLWVIGLFVGIDLIFNGWSWMFLALNVRMYDKTPSAGGTVGEPARV